MACASGGVFLWPVLPLSDMQSEVRSRADTHGKSEPKSPGRPRGRAWAPLFGARRRTGVPSGLLWRVLERVMRTEGTRRQLRRVRARAHSGGSHGAGGRVRNTLPLRRARISRARFRWCEEIVVLAGKLDQCLCLPLYRSLASCTVRVRRPRLRQLSGPGPAVAVVRWSQD